MPFTAQHILRCYQRCTESIVAEHHPDDDGMRYLLRIVGGKHNGTEIHCKTRQSVETLFEQIVAARKADTEHPFLAEV
jgi:hypothetical protein